MKLLWGSVLGAFLVLGTACGDDAGPFEEDGGVENNPTTDTTTDTAGDGDGDGDATTVRITGFVGEYVDGFPALEGITVFLVDHDDIDPVLTDENGLYAFDVPAGAEIIVYAEADAESNRHPAASRIITLGDSDFNVGPLFLFDKAVTNYTAGLSEVEYDETKGYVTGGVWRDTDEVLVDAEVTLSPGAGKLVYNDAGGLPDPSAEGTTASATFGIWNVDIGTYEFTGAHDSTSRCWAAGPDQPETVRIRTFPDTATFSLAFLCGD